MIIDFEKLVKRRKNETHDKAYIRGALKFKRKFDGGITRSELGLGKYRTKEDAINLIMGCGLADDYNTANETLEGMVTKHRAESNFDPYIRTNHVYLHAESFNIRQSKSNKYFIENYNEDLYHRNHTKKLKPLSICTATLLHLAYVGTALATNPGLLAFLFFSPLTFGISMCAADEFIFGRKGRDDY
jgi:hypothetical protein